MSSLPSIRPPSDLRTHPRLSDVALEWNIPEEAYWVLIKLALKWTDVVDAKNLSVHRLKGAMTNELYECRWAQEDEQEQDGKNPPRKVIVRVYGQGIDLFFNREDEIGTFECMSRHGQGPRLLGRFSNGRVEEFLHARTLSASDLRDPEISFSIAVKLKEFHELDMPGSRQPQLWQRLRYIFFGFEAEFTEQIFHLEDLALLFIYVWFSSVSNWLQKSLTLCRPEHVEEFHLRSLAKEIEDLKKRISKPEDRLGFCHNDLQYGNIMIDEKDKSLTIIDYEYASYNPVAYDLANHFCEMAADYHSDSPHLLDYSKYPGFQERCRFIEAYLNCTGENISESEIKQLCRETDGYALASHIHWGLWGIISACVNEIDFDYLEYARQRFQKYYASKALLYGELDG